MTKEKDVSLYAPAKSPNDLAELTDNIIKDPPAELSARQRRIINYRLRGMTQAAIASLEKVSQPMIAKEQRRIREIYKEQGRTIDSELVMGETVSLYQEIERRGWELYFLHKEERPSAANKALDTIMASRDKTIKLMMDLGIMKKAAKEVEHKIQVAPFMEQFASLSAEKKQAALSNVITIQLEDLDEPEPPRLEADYILLDEYNVEEPEPPEEEEEDERDEDNT